MIIVRVELLSAITGKTTELARMHIINDGHGTHTVGNYEVRQLRGRSKAQLDGGTVQRKGEVKDHPRLSSHVWKLVAKALAAVGHTA